MRTTRHPNKVAGMLKKAWKLRNKLRQKQKDKKRRSRPTTSTAPELGRHERREEDDGGATTTRTAPARVTKASSDSEDIPPDWGGKCRTRRRHGRPAARRQRTRRQHGRPATRDEEHAEDTQWSWGRHGRPSDRGDSPLHLAVRPNEPAEEPPNQRPRPRQATAAGSEMETRGTEQCAWFLT